MKRKQIFWTVALLLAAVVLVSCKNAQGGTKVSATGSIYECLVVMPSRPLANPQAVVSGSAYAEDIATTYDMVKAVMAADMPCLPQMEPYFKLTHVTPAAFDDFLKPTRNILIVDIDANRYTQTKAKYSLDYWSHPQAVYRIQVPDDDAFIAYWKSHGEEVREWFVKQEIERQKRFYRASTNKDARAVLQKRICVDMLIPEDYMLIMDTVLIAKRSYSASGLTANSEAVNLVWCCNNKGPMRRDLVVYSYPYTDLNTFTPEFLNAKRDEVLGKVITASVPGSYMGTEYKVFPPQMRVIQADPYKAEIRGLWKIYNGEALGGPYVSHTCVDEVNHRVITAEAYVMAPGQKKRNALRQAEAILYTLVLPQEMNKLEEVVVSR
ncbi:MAG: DUF4837 family protein [Paludibacteraceae bacterium]|nr:DUF4837 family protein [Paludibacteraceae bacterium]